MANQSCITEMEIINKEFESELTKMEDFFEIIFFHIQYVTVDGLPCSLSELFQEFVEFLMRPYNAIQSYLCFNLILHTNGRSFSAAVRAAAAQDTTIKYEQCQLSFLTPCHVQQYSDNTRICTLYPSRFSSTHKSPITYHQLFLGRPYIYACVSMFPVS